ncbi:MAG: CCA tRNA nucleotidyltransferase [Candidatus Rokubacteria bacterium]|nr:CCA tRNA nucleotidyltransferase [Candidatus Rokubacteria bacterium]
MMIAALVRAWDDRGGHVARVVAGASRSSRRSRYPQVEPGSLALGHRAVAVCSADAAVAEAARLLRRSRARILVVQGTDAIGVAQPEDLRRAQAFGLAKLPVGDVSRWDVPVVTADTAEVRVRRLLLAGAPTVLVKARGAVVAAVESGRWRRATGRDGGGAAALALAGRLARDLPVELLDFLRGVGRLAELLNTQAYVAGGFVRDLLRGAASQDLDVVVEGDALALARRLCRQLGGSLVVHRAFGTASIEGWSDGRVDVAMARRERYAAPGALPVVHAAGIEADLARRDFTVNAMALALTGPRFGQLLDPFGGWRDLGSGAIRILHPLAFVEDPTRIFRAVRYATRLGFRIDRWTRKSLAVALSLGAYPALSGQRLLAELELIMGEAGWDQSLLTLGRLRAFRLLDPGYRFSPNAAARLRALAELLRWAREAGVALEALPLALLCVVGHLPAPLAERCLRRLALSGEPLARLLEAYSAGPSVARRLEGQADAPRSRCAAILRARTTETVGFAWLVGSRAVRERVQWFLAEGQGVRPLLSGRDLLALGVAKGPAVSRLLQALRDRRLDGEVSSREGEVRLIREWLSGDAGTPARATEEG